MQTTGMMIMMEVDDNQDEMMLMRKVDNNHDEMMLMMKVMIEKHLEAYQTILTLVLTISVGRKHIFKNKYERTNERV